MGVADGFMPKKEMIQYHTEKLKTLKKDKTYIVYNINRESAKDQVINKDHKDHFR